MEARADLKLGVLSVRFAKAIEELDSIWSHNHRKRSLATLPTEALAPSEDTLAFGGDLPRERVEELTAERFSREYGRARRPVMLLGAAKDWRALQRWSSQEELLKHYGDIPFKVTERGMCGNHSRLELPLRLYVQHAEAVAADSPFYIFERNLDGPRTPLMEDFEPPRFFQDDLYDITEYTRAFLPTHRYYVIGVERTGSNLHVDPCCTSAWNTLLCGLKRWVLFPPGDAEEYLEAIGAASRGMDTGEQVPAYWWLDVLPKLRASGAAESLGMVECVQRPGETIFVPAGWWHAVLNLGFTAAVTQNLLAADALDYAWPGLAAEWPDFAPRFARLLRELRPDVELPAAARAAAEAADCDTERAAQSIEPFAPAWADAPLPRFGLPGALVREVELCDVAQGLQARGNSAVERHRSHREAVQWHSEALAVLEGAGAVGPSAGALEAEVRVSRAKCNLELGRFAEVLLDCEAIAREAPARLMFASSRVQAKASRYMALALLALGREEEARAALQRCIDAGLPLVQARRGPAPIRGAMEEESGEESEDVARLPARGDGPSQATAASGGTLGPSKSTGSADDKCEVGPDAGPGEAEGAANGPATRDSRPAVGGAPEEGGPSPSGGDAGEPNGRAKEKEESKGKGTGKGKGRGKGKGKAGAAAATKAGVKQSFARLLRELKPRRSLEGGARPGQMPASDFLDRVAAGCHERRTDEVRKAVLEGACRVDARDGSNQNALWLALDLGGSEMVEALLELRADPAQRYRQLATPLMLAAQRGNARAARALLRRGAAPDAPDAHGRSALLLACEAMGGARPAGGDAGTPSPQARGAAAVVQALLEARADANLRDFDGQAPLHVAAMRCDWPLALQLLDGGARLGEHHHTLGFTPCSLAQRGAPGCEATSGLRQAAQRSDAWPREAASLQAESWWRLTEERLRPLAKEQAGGMTEVPKLRALVAALLLACELDAVPIERSRDEGANPLLALHRELIDVRMPAACKKLWADPEQASEEDVMCAMVATGRRPLSKHSSGRACAGQDAFRELIFTPLTRCFSFAVPDDAALACVTEHSPVVEMGAGSGYWAALLEARGCDVVAFDFRPPTMGESANDMCYNAYTEVRYGEPEDLVKHCHRSLLLAWPVPAAELPQSEAGDAWDAACLTHYGGSTVIHVGEMSGSGAFPGSSQTTSVAFQRRLQAEFQCIKRLPLPRWPHVQDCLTVWRRRSEAR